MTGDSPGHSHYHSEMELRTATGTPDMDPDLKRIIEILMTITGQDFCDKNHIGFTWRKWWEDQHDSQPHWLWAPPPNHSDEEDSR